MRSQTGIRRQNRAMANSIATNDRIYDNRAKEHAQFVSKLSVAQKNRNAGQVTVNGHTVYRQEPLTRVLIGNRCLISFSIDHDVQGRYAIVDADDLQPSHLGSVLNPLHFIPEAQPRNRSTSKSGAETPERIARNLRPDEVLYGTPAYTGAPIVNERGEIIQGNGRGYALKMYYQMYPGDPKGYVKAIEAANHIFGFLFLEDLLTKNKIDKPVLVRMVHTNDPTAIILGQFTQADLEAVTTLSQQSKAKARLLTPVVLRKVVGELLQNDHADATLTELIRAGNALKVLIRENVLRADDLENYTKNGAINDRGVQFITDLLVNALFADADINVPDVFAASPIAVQNIVKKSALFLLRIPVKSRSIGREIGNAVYAYRNFQSSGIGGYRSWLTQFDLSGKMPIDRYANLELKIAELFAENGTQKLVVSDFRKYSELVMDRPADMFSKAKPGLTKNLAIKAVFGVKPYVSDVELRRLRSAHGRLRQAKNTRKSGAEFRNTKHQEALEPVYVSSPEKAKARARAKAKLLLLAITF